MNVLKAEGNFLVCGAVAFFTLTPGNSESSNLYLWRAEINKFFFPKWKRRNVHIYKDYIKKWNALFDIYLKMCFLDSVWKDLEI